ncbi:hypothetical protein DOY81_008969, partial [Sarcophaga bullata]
MAYHAYVSVIFSYIGVSIVLFFVSRFSPYEWRIVQYQTGKNTHHHDQMANQQPPGIIGGVPVPGPMTAVTPGVTGPTGAPIPASSTTAAVNDFSILNSFWFSLAAFMQQGCDVSPRSHIWTYCGCCMVVLYVDTYFIIHCQPGGFLTVERMVTPINSPEDLAMQTEVQYGTYCMAQRGISL